MSRRPNRMVRTRTGLLLAAAYVLWAATAVQAALPEGLVAYYRFNAASGLTAIDETGTHNGTLTGALAWVPGVEGNALEFRGGNGSPFVNLGAWQTNGPEGLSLALWVKWAGNNSLYQGLISQRQGTMYWWTEVSNNAAELRFKSNTSPQSNLLLTTPHLAQDEWMHVAFSHDAATSQGTIYLNGEEKRAGAWSLPSGNFANLNVGIGVVNTGDGLGTFNGLIDEAMIFDRPVSPQEVAGAMKGFADPTAGEPSPANGQSDVPVDVALSWTPNEVAETHDVYLGTSSDDVTAAETGDPRGVLVSPGQAETIYEPAAPLEYGTTYFWRIDEVNGAPDNTVFKGETWSFTTEPFSYPITGVTATASSATANMGPEKAVDGSGLTGDLHSVDGQQMWLSNPAGPQPTWIQFEFDKAYKLDEMWVWNSNQVVEAFIGFGAKAVTVEYSTDGATWTELADAPEFAQGTGADTYAHNTTVDFGGVEAQYVKLTMNSNWGTLPQYGLSEVRFYYVPVQARLPEPADASTGIGVDATLNWRPGREATSHLVTIDTDQQAVADGTATADTVSDHSYTPDSLDFGTAYYWKVDEVGDTGAYPGAVWSFTTEEFAAIDDMESYTDDIDAETTIWHTWIDGLTTGASGSQVGYDVAPFAERTIVHGGTQSMPLKYDNSVAPFFSEAEREFASNQNWTLNGADTLSLWAQGVPVGFVEDGGTITMGGGGHDIWDAADDFRFAYKTLNGDGSIVVKVESIVNTNAWAKAGVMIRQSLDADSKFVYMIESFSSGVSMGWRPTTAAGCGSATQAGITAPQWVKLIRKGDVFTAQYSADGTTWTDLKAADGTIASTTVAMTNPVYIGLCVTSHNAAAMTTAVMSGAAATGNVMGASWQVLAIGDDPQPANDPGELYVIVEDSTGKTATATNATAVTTGAWTEWQIPLSDLAGVNMARVKKLILGVDSRNSAVKGAGMIYVDDIAYGKPAAGQ